MAWAQHFAELGCVIIMHVISVHLESIHNAYGIEQARPTGGGVSKIPIRGVEVN